MFLVCSCFSQFKPEQTQIADSIKEKQSADQLKILTYNILSSNQFKQERHKQIIELLTKSEADIVGLQEVDKSFLEKIYSDTTISKTYNFSTTFAGHKALGGLLLLSKFPFERIYYSPMSNSYMNRYLLIGEFVINKDTLAVGVVHLESPLNATALRSLQLEEAFGNLNKQSNTILLGDFNFGDIAPKETSKLDKSYVDLWRETYPDSVGLTYDLELNPLALQNAYSGESSRRLDKILLKSDEWKCSKMELFGNQTFRKSTEIFPSDHFGVLSILKLTTKNK